MDKNFFDEILKNHPIDESIRLKEEEKESNYQEFLIKANEIIDQLERSLVDPDSSDGIMFSYDLRDYRDKLEKAKETGVVGVDDDLNKIKNTLKKFWPNCEQ